MQKQSNKIEETIPVLLKEHGFKTTRFKNEFIKSGFNIKLDDQRIDVTRYNPRQLTYMWGETYYNFDNFIRYIKKNH